MNNAESNPSQPQQKTQQATSPGTTPATETARIDPQTAAAELDPASVRKTPAPPSDDPSPLPSIDDNRSTASSGDPVVRASSRIVSTDNANMEATDDTVDTDRKNLDAKRDLSPMHDNVVGSNATLDDSVATPAFGLGGIDSRSDGNRPSIALRPGWTMRHEGTMHLPTSNGGRTEHIIFIDRTSN
jgi:hypothetical protein